MPFALGSCYDCVGAWIYLNSKYHHCFICTADHIDSKIVPRGATLLPPRTIELGASLRREANDVAKPEAVRCNARQQLDSLNLHPEPTALDSIAEVQQGALSIS